MLVIFIGIIFTLVISFLWALISLRKELKKVKSDTYQYHSRNELVEGEEIVLFERTRIE